MISICISKKNIQNIHIVAIFNYFRFCIIYSKPNVYFFHLNELKIYLIEKNLIKNRLNYKINKISKFAVKWHPGILL